jgi:LPS-assembly protein
MPGSLVYKDQLIELNADSASYNLAAEAGEFSGLEYVLATAAGRGSAAAATLLSQNHTRLNRVDFTSCPQGINDWQIEAEQITLNQLTGRGTAKKAKVVFKGVPILYAPKFSFPIDDRRQSGFLYPTLGSASDNGLDISVPWYWNIAPQMDAMLTPRIITDKGLMLGSQFRWLTRRTFGQIDTDYLPDDDETNTERHFYRLEHRFRINKAWRTDVLASRVSDDRYFIDFGRSLAQTSRQFLRSAASLQGKGNYWNFSLGADDFQVIDPAVGENREPYRRLPRLRYGLDMPLGNSPIDLQIDSELVYFDRDIGVTGTRLDVFPLLRWNYERSAGFITPAVGYRSTSYDIDRLNSFSDDSPSRGTVIASLDGGLFFDRELESGNLQTLEPRFFYLYVPYEFQDDLPDFDTAELTYGFSQLFHTNRFAGADRQGDASQLTLALSSRIMDAKTGLERFTINAGQLFYFSDRRVQLRPGDLTATESSNDFVLEMTWRPSRAILASTGLQWDWDKDKVNVGWASIEYT